MNHPQTLDLTVCDLRIENGGCVLVRARACVRVGECQCMGGVRTCGATFTPRGSPGPSLLTVDA